MERALKSFLDGISEDDNVVNLETVVKKENDEPQEVIEQGTGSGMLDMRAMAQRYQEMSSSDVSRPVAKPAVEPPLPGQLVRPTLLAPVVVEVDDSEEGRGWLIAVVALAVLVTIVSTAAITAVIVKRSVMAEIRNMGAVPQSPTTQEATAAAVVAPETEQVAQWPEADPTLAAGTGTDDDSTDPEMDFRESDVDAVEKRPKKDPEEKTNDDPTPRPTLTVPVTTTPEDTDPVKEPTTTTPEPTTEPKPKVAKDGEPCDEVLCLVDGRGCCGTAKKAPKAEAAVDSSLPERLERNDIKEGLATIDGRLNSCGVRFEIAGVVTLKLSIGADGKVTQGSANTGSDEFQSCISQTLKKARFAKTQQGGTLNYPVILR